MELAKNDAPINGALYQCILSSDNQIGQVNPEKLDNFKGSLIRLMTSSDQRVKESIEDFLYFICDSDCKESHY